MRFKEKSAQTFGRLKQTAADVFVDVTSHWRKPAKGNYVPYKEMLHLGLGGMGQQLFLTTLLGYIGFSASNYLLGSAIGLRPMHLQIMATIQTVLNVFLYIIRGKIVDNTRTRFGRFRPYIAIMGLPIAIMGAIFVFLDFGTMSYIQKLMFSFGFCIAISMISPFLTDTYGELTSVMTANSKERTLLMTVNSIFYSLMPTITGLFIPILTDLTGGYTNINTYRYIMIPLAFLGCGFNLFTAFGCKERVISSKTYVQKVGMWKGCTQIFRNKYWHLRNIAGAVGFLESANLVLFGWIYIYSTQNMVEYGILTTVLGTASLIAMVSTPFALSRLGNRGILIFHNALNVVFVTLMIFTFKVPMLYFLFLYLNTIVSQLAIVYNPAQHAEVKDYQQYLSKTRMDFTFGAAGQIMVPISIATGYFIPFIYESFGLTTNYDILYDPMVRNKLFTILCAISAVGALLNLIPYCFYTLSREKHRNYVKVIQYRAVLQDYANGDVSPELIKSAVEGVHEALALASTPPPDLKKSKAAISAARAAAKTTEAEKDARKAAIKAAKKAYFADKKLKEEISAAQIVIDEIHKFDDPITMKKLGLAQEIAAIAVEELVNLDAAAELQKAKALPKTEKQDKKFRRYALKRARAIAKMVRKIKKHYPGGLHHVTSDRVTLALNMPYSTAAERKARRIELKAAEKEFNGYCKTVEPFLEARELVKEYEIKDNFNILETLYDDACAEVAEKEAAQAELARVEREEKQAELERLREERWSKLPPEKAEQKRAAYNKRKERLMSIQAAIKNTSTGGKAEIVAEEERLAAADLLDSDKKDAE